MLLIEELIDDENLFKYMQFKFIIGEYPTYNKKFYKLTLKQDESETEIGIQTIYFGIKPQTALHDNKLLLGAGEKFYVYELNGNLLKEYQAYPIFYEFFICKDNILVVNELSVFLLDANYNKVWEKAFSEIIDIFEVKESTIILRDYNGIFIYLDLLTGKEI